MMSQAPTTDVGTELVAAARHLFTSDVMSHSSYANFSARPDVSWGSPRSDVSVPGIAEALQQHPSASAALFANHGLLAVGKDSLGTARLLPAIEEAAEAELAVEAIGVSMDFCAGAIEAVRASIARVRS